MRNVTEPSSWWHYFRKSDKTNFVAVCNTCAKELDQGKSLATSVLKHHLKTQHKELYTKYTIANEKVKSEIAKRKQELEKSNHTLDKMFAKSQPVNLAKSSSADNSLAICVDIDISENEQTRATSSATEPGEPGFQAKKRRLNSGQNVQHSPILVALKNWDSDGAQSLKVDRLICEFIACDGRPMSTMEKTGFRRLVNGLMPAYKIKSRRYYANMLFGEGGIYAKLQRRISADLRNVDDLAITTDLWSNDSGIGHHLLALTGHFVTRNFELGHVIIGATPIKEVHHTGSVIAENVMKMLEDMDVPLEKVRLAISDHASNVVNAINQLGLKFWGCFAHKINLSLKAGLVALKFDSSATFEKIKSFVRKINKSNVQKSYFLQLQKNLDLPTKLLTKHVEVRWSSLHEMLLRFIENRDVIEMYTDSEEAVQANKNKPLPSLTVPEWEKIKLVSEVLGIINELYVEIQNRRQTIATVLPFYFAINKKLNNISLARDTELMRMAFLQKLDSLMEGWEEDKFLVISTALDPRFKVSMLSQQKACLKDQTRGWIQYEFQQIHSVGLRVRDERPRQVPARAAEIALDGAGTSTAAAPAQKRQTPAPNFISCLFDECDVLETETDENEDHVLDSFTLSMAEFDKFSSEKRELWTCDPMLWWRGHAHEYPNLGRLARKFLCPPVGSVECERLFSGAAFILSDLRKSMSMESLKKLLLIYHNLPLYNFDI